MLLTGIARSDPIFHNELMYITFFRPASNVELPESRSHVTLRCLLVITCNPRETIEADLTCAIVFGQSRVWI